MLSRKEVKIGFFEKFGYGLGDTASNLFFMNFIYFLTYFYTDVFGITALAAGTMFALTRIWDGINDPLMGIIADRTHTRWGKFRPYLLWMVLPYGIVGVLMFTTPNYSMSDKIVYAYVTYTLMMMVYTAINIPYSSLMGVVSSNPLVRTQFSQYRFILAFTGGLIVQAATIPMVNSFGRGDKTVVQAHISGNHQIVLEEKGEGAAKIIITQKSTDRQTEKPGPWQQLLIAYGVKPPADPVKNAVVWVYRPENLAATSLYDSTAKVMYLTEGFRTYNIALNNLYGADDLERASQHFVVDVSDNHVVEAAIDQKQQVVLNELGQGDFRIKISNTKGLVPVKEFDFRVVPAEQLPKKLLVDTTKQVVYLRSGFASQRLPVSAFFLALQPSTYELSTVNERIGFRNAISVFALLAVIMFVVTFFATKERIAPPPKQQSSIWEDLRNLVTNGPWVLLFFMGIFTLSHVCLRNGSIMFYFKYYVGNTELAAAFMLLGTLATLAAIPLTGWVSKIIGKKKAYIFCMGMTTVLSVLYYFIEKENIMLIFVMQILANFFFGPTAPLVFAMYTDSADYSEWKTGKRATGLVMSASTMAQKWGWAIGGYLTGVVLTIYGFEANVKQTPETIVGIKSMMSWIPAIASFLAGLMMVFYKLDEHKMKEIETELEKRRLNI